MSNQSCPMCAAVRVRVVEDVSDEVIVFACDNCDATWADRVVAFERDLPPRDAPRPDQ